MQLLRGGLTQRFKKMSLRMSAVACACLIGALLSPRTAFAEHKENEAQQIQELRSMVLRLQDRVDGLERQLNDRRTINTTDYIEPPHIDLAAQGPSAVTVATPHPLTETSAATAPPIVPAPSPKLQAPAQASAASTLASVIPATLPGGATLNYMFDGYYEFNFNRPPGRVNDLRAFDVLSNTFSINQADLMFDLDPDTSKGRRYGLRVDLQFGQATAALQGNPANEARPQIYQNIFQAYGTYIVPIGTGLTMDVGKWASSLGLEGNYTKDQLNYTRSFFFYFLPFYHEGIRTNYKFNDKIAANYWVVNGTNQSEPTNGFKDEMFGVVLTPTKTITWTSNYYFGQEHPDSLPATNCTLPVQPGLCVAPINPAPNGKLHIVDDYVTWQTTPKLLLAAEGDYVIQREWAHAAPGESSAPSHLDGGAAYAQYQLTTKTALATRGEYMSDRQGLFSNHSQALKEITATYKYSFAGNFDTFVEYRRDWTNTPFFLTHNTSAPSQHQTTAVVGLVWWYGGKQGAW